MKLIIDIPEKFFIKDDLIRFFGCYSQKLDEVIKNGTPIPDNATNGEVVKSIFTNTLDNFCERTTWEWNRWWNALYQKGTIRNENT